MRDIKTLRAEIAQLHRAMTENNFYLKREKRAGRIVELMAARIEIYKSITHRQFLLLEIYETMAEFEREVA